MSCNCTNTNPNLCPDPLQCPCGLTISIYNPEGVFVESVQATTFQGEGGYYYVVVNSTAFNSVLPSGYELTIYYNYELERWEMSYYDFDLELNILLGVLYGLEPTDCPLNGCWDLDCNAVAHNQLGAIIDYFYWEGAYVNGKKYYEFTSDWSGSDINYRLSWYLDIGTTFPLSAAPVGTPGWVLEEEASPGVWQVAAYLFNSNKCPYGQYVSEFGGGDTRYSFTDLGVTGFDMKSTATDCGCCDTEIIVNINGVDYTAVVEYDEYGNILVNNGKQYYVFLYEDKQYYVYFNGTNWVIATDCDNYYRVTEDGQPRITEDLNYRIID